MIETTALIRILASFVIAGGWIGTATILSEKLGSKWGGLITNLPSNILVSLVFVSLNKGAIFAANTVFAVPIGMLIDTIFLLLFIILLRKGLVTSIIVSLGSWLLMAIIANALNFQNLPMAIVLYIISVIVCYYIAEYKLKIPNVKKTHKKFSMSSLLIRSTFAGAIVATTVTVSLFARPYLVGLVTTFPAILLTSMIILTISQNAKFSQATGKVLLVSSSNIIIYSLAVYLTYPTIGIIYGSLVSFVLAFIWVLLMNPVIKKFSQS